MLDVVSRTINHNPDVLFNRWHFAGTSLALKFQSPKSFWIIEPSPTGTRTLMSFWT
jgi:hypothetical protein